MSCFLRSLLSLVAVLAATAGVQAAGKAHHPAAHHAAKSATHAVHAKPAAKGHRSANHQTHKAPRHVSQSKVKHHARPAVNRRPAKRVQQRTKPNVRRTVSRTKVRSVQRYPVNRVRRQLVFVPSSVNGRSRHHHHHRRYSFSYYPGRYAWRSSAYNRGSGGSRRHASRGIRGVVESVQGNANNGTLVVRTIRPRSSRFQNAANRKGGRATSLRRVHLNNGTNYQILSNPAKGGTMADLHKGAHVLILTHTKPANTAQKVEVSPLRKR